MVGLFIRRAPHCHQLVADIVDQNSPMFEHAFREHGHDVTDPGDALRRFHLLAGPAKPNDIAEQHRHFGFGRDRQDVGIFRSFFNQP